MGLIKKIHGGKVYSTEGGIAGLDVEMPNYKGTKFEKEGTASGSGSADAKEISAKEDADAAMVMAHKGKFPIEEPEAKKSATFSTLADAVPAESPVNSTKAATPLIYATYDKKVPVYDGNWTAKQDKKYHDYFHTEMEKRRNYIKAHVEFIKKQIKRGEVGKKGLQTYSDDQKKAKSWTQRLMELF
jgi:hypothetical protein